MKIKSLIYTCLCILLSCILLQASIQSPIRTLAATVTENSAATFNGTFSNLAYDTGLGGVALQSGQSSGSYTSQVINGGAGAQWTGLKYSTNAPILKELPDNKINETGYASGNINMSTNLGLYHFNENSGVGGAVDSSGNNFNLTTPVAPGRTSTAIYRNAVQFNTQTNTIFNGPVGIGSTGRSQFTMSVWIRMDSLTSVDQFIYYESVGGNNTRPRFRVYVTSAGLVGFQGHNNDTVTTPSYTILSAQPIPVGGAYALVTAVFDGTNGQARLFINGTQAGSATFATGTTLPSTTPALLPRIGINQGTNGLNKLRAKIDELATFSSALSSTQIANVFNRGAYRILLQARSCSDTSCSSSNFVGPTGTTSNSNAFSPLNANSSPPETFTLNQTFFPSNQYFQYRIIFEPNQGITSTGLSPVVQYVEISYTPGAAPDPEIGFSIRNSLDTTSFTGCNLGQVTTTATSVCAYRIKVVSANLNGYSIFTTTSGGLGNGSGTVANAGAAPTGSVINSATLGNERYGVNVIAGSITSGIVAVTAPFSSANSVNFSHTAPTALILATGNNQPSAIDTTNTTLVTHSLNISSSTAPGIYSQVVTYTLVPNY